LTRPPLDAALVREAVVRPGGMWTSVTVREVTGSTNADLACGEHRVGSVLVAESQTAGRGRLDRRWVSPPRAALTFSVLVRPAVPASDASWLPVLAGLAVAAAIGDVTGLDARLKWPNDVLIGDRKLAGILAEQSAAGVIVGIGLNVSTTAAELPPPGLGSLRPTSLLIEGAGTERAPLLIAILTEFERRYREPAAVLREEYLARCATIGRDVRVELPNGRLLRGTAETVDPSGCLVVRPAGAEPVAVIAGDVVHVR
jgi:BirA family transcriptional regulator, biotin operon repressor / biotin---[acetyl-CoA-carboxylase] ligase